MSRQFIETLREIRGGAALTECAAELQTLVAAVRATQKAGKLTLTITIAPLKQGGDNTLLIKDDVKLAVPEPDRPSTILYATDDNELSRKDPRQPELTGLREVGKVTQMPPVEKAEAQ